MINIRGIKLKVHLSCVFTFVCVIHVPSAFYFVVVIIHDCALVWEHLICEVFKDKKGE